MATMIDTALNVAHVYAEALLAAANAQGQTDEVGEQFDDLLAYARKDRDFWKFMTALSVDDDVRRASLERLFRGKMNDLLLNLLCVLNDRQRSDILDAVHATFRHRLKAQRGQVEVHVRSATPLPDDLLGRLQAALSEGLGKQALLVTKVDESLIGGIVVQAGDRRLDASVKRRLGKLHAMFLARASDEIHKHRAELMTG